MTEREPVDLRDGCWPFLAEADLLPDGGEGGVGVVKDGQGEPPTIPTANQAQLPSRALVCSWGFLSPVLFSFLKYTQTCLCSFRFQL